MGQVRLGTTLRAFADACRRKDLSRWSASIAFFGFLSLCPALLAFFAGLALWWQGGDPERELAWLLTGLPIEAASLIRGEAQRMAERAPSPLGFGLGVSILGSLWSGSRGVSSLMQGVNAAYGRTERGGVAHRLLAVALSLAAFALVALTLGAVVWIPLALRWVRLDAVLDLWLRWGRWPLLATALLAGMAGLYRFSPPRPPTARAVVWPGACLACVGLLVGSALFTRFVASADRWHFTYGALTGVILLLLWLYGSAWLTLAGASWNALIEAHPRPSDPPAPSARRSEGTRGATSSTSPPGVA